MNELIISLDDEERRGWLLCSYCRAQIAFLYKDVGYEATGRPESIPAAQWINAHRTGQAPFGRCGAARSWETNRYKVIDWRHGDHLIREGLIRVTIQVDIE